MKEIKQYQITVYLKTELGKLLLAQIKSNWLPDDPERFAWELGGNEYDIVELEPKKFQTTTEWPPKHLQH